MKQTLIGLLFFAAGACAQTTPLFSSASGTSCSADLVGPAGGGQTITINCSQEGIVVPAITFPLPVMLGVGIKGIALQLNDILMMFRRAVAADPLSVKVAVNQYDTSGKLVGNKTVVDKTVAVP